MNNLFFILFLVFVVMMLVLDLVVFNKKDHVVGMRQAAWQTLMWVGLAVVFALVVRFFPQWIHNDPTANGAELMRQFVAGYLLEESLSIDNIFVMIMIFASFGVAKEYYHRVLFWGIFGAIVLRFIFIFALSGLIDRFEWLLALFGAVLVYSGVKMFRKQGDEQVDTANHPIVRFASKHFNVTSRTYGHDFFHREGGKFYITPLFLVLLVIEFSDIIFAVDSIPAVFSVSRDPVIVFTSNIFAVMGLRSLFFLLDGIAARFWLLHYGLGVLLCFIGVKMIGGEFFGWEIPTGVSLAVILAILVLSVVLSGIIKKPGAKA